MINEALMLMQFEIKNWLCYVFVHEKYTCGFLNLNNINSNNIK
jgi:hypothetical protein